MKVSRCGFSSMRWARESYARMSPVQFSQPPAQFACAGKNQSRTPGASFRRSRQWHIVDERSASLSSYAAANRDCVGLLAIE